MGCSGSKSDVQFGKSRILMLGLDDSGKTKILYKMTLGQDIQTIPTIGFNVEDVGPIKGVNFTVWDVGGQEKIRTLWRHYYESTAVLIFVVDSSDTERLEEAKECLDKVCQDDAFVNTPIMILANKQDLPGALSADDVVDKLDMTSRNIEKWDKYGVSATSGEGLTPAFKVIADMVITSRSTKRRVKN